MRPPAPALSSSSFLQPRFLPPDSSAFLSSALAPASVASPLSAAGLPSSPSGAPYGLATVGALASWLMLLCVAQELPYDLGENVGIRFRRWVRRYPALFAPWKAFLRWLGRQTRLVSIGDYILTEHMRLSA
ncbi:hypothetical protein BESB_025630 [Besnoitia besnoiti]|uniref:Uncharacterized protein n=1 Tax=Besnoitia besnoiti TaxID=94643 RepID=A0A2A9M0V3_BESBE|nr:uncharacterized protein BESB_025630 [Besnoitia besnoiti]PFH31589.1 hypothetical protein BESB_025630 [Besnoitia besnoiti]